MDDQLIKNPYYRVLGTLIAELAAMGVDLKEVERITLNRLETGLPFTNWGELDTQGDAEVARVMFSSFEYLLTT